MRIDTSKIFSKNEIYGFHSFKLGIQIEIDILDLIILNSSIEGLSFDFVAVQFIDDKLS